MYSQRMPTDSLDITWLYMMVGTGCMTCHHIIKLYNAIEQESNFSDFENKCS